LSVKVVDLPIKRQSQPGQKRRLREEFNTITHKRSPLGRPPLVPKAPCLLLSICPYLELLTAPGTPYSQQFLLLLLVPLLLSTTVTCTKASTCNLQLVPLPLFPFRSILTPCSRVAPLACFGRYAFSFSAFERSFGLPSPCHASLTLDASKRKDIFCYMQMLVPEPCL
jgi:hypothetical protein